MGAMVRIRLILALVCWVALIHPAGASLEALYLGSGSIQDMGDSCTKKSGEVLGYQSAFKRESGRCYVFFSEPRSFAMAQSTCTNGGGYLVTLTTEAEGGFVQGDLLKSKCQGNAWLGYTDVEDQGVWKWVSGEIAIGPDGGVFRKWADSVIPVAATRRCGAVVCADGTWSATDCATKLPFTCEYPAAAVASSEPSKSVTPKTKLTDAELLSQFSKASAEINSLLETRTKSITEQEIKLKTELKDVANNLAEQSKKYKNDARDVKEDAMVMKGLQSLGSRYASAILRDYRTVRNKMRKIDAVHGFKSTTMKVHSQLATVSRGLRYARKNQRVMYLRLKAAAGRIEKMQIETAAFDKAMRDASRKSIVEAEELLLQAAEMGPRINIQLADLEKEGEEFSTFMESNKVSPDMSSNEITVKQLEVAENTEKKVEGNLRISEKWDIGEGMSCSCSRTLKVPLSKFDKIMAEGEPKIPRQKIPLDCLCKGEVLADFVPHPVPIVRLGP